ncbi:MAG: putative signal transducing protein [Phycisphaerae bacterium]
MICVFRAQTLSEADIVAAVLQANGFHAIVKDRNAIAMGTISPFSSDVRAGMFPVLVPTEEEAEEAIQFLQQVGPQQPDADDRMADQEDAGSGAEAICGGCEEQLWYEADEAGSIVRCPHCDIEVELPPFPSEHDDHA